MTDGPTFFGPEGVTKGPATPPPAPQAPQPAPPPKPEPERKTFTEVDTAEAPRRMSGPMWAALGVLAACALMAGWFFTRPEAPKYDMNSKKIPLGRFHVTPAAFIKDKTGKDGMVLTIFAARIGNNSKKPQIASEAKVQLLDAQERYFDPIDLEKFNISEDATWKHMIGDSARTPMNPGVLSKRAWMFAVPFDADIRFAYVFDQEQEQNSVRIEVWRMDLPADW